MAWIYFQELEGLDSDSIDGFEQSHIVNKTDTHKAFFCPECDQVKLIELQSGTTCRHSTKNCFRTSILSSGGFLARISALREMVQAWTESEAVYFSKLSGSSKRYDLLSSSLKTSLQSGQEDLIVFASSWPQWGMISDGLLSVPQALEPLTKETDGSYLPTPTAQAYGTNKGGALGRVGKVRMSLETMAKRNHWPTPRANDSQKRGNFDQENKRNGLAGAVKRFPTPTARDFRTPCQGDLNRKTPSLATISFGTGGQLSPMWVEWLMGYRTGWTELDASAMQWFQYKSKRRLKG